MKKNTDNFYSLLLIIFAQNWKNYYEDNFDQLRFGKIQKEVVDGKKSLIEISERLNKLEAFYNILSDHHSKEILLQVLAFRILGHRKLKLPLSYTQYWQAIADIDKIMEQDKELCATYLNSKINLSFIDLEKLGIPIKLYTTARSVLSQFFLKQYEYVTQNNIKIGPQPGDIVIDGGACWERPLYYLPIK